MFLLCHGVVGIFEREVYNNNRLAINDMNGFISTIKHLLYDS